MFTIPTLPKILLIVLVIGAVWWWYRRSQIRARERAEELDRNARGGVAKGKAAKPVEDMVKCKICAAYVPAKGATRCGRDNCPF